jgi:hypothetical protein
MTLNQVQAAVDANANWLEDCLVMLLCVLALDRFGDYGSDQVTAPVSEPLSNNSRPDWLAALFAAALKDFFLSKAAGDSNTHCCGEGS